MSKKPRPGVGQPGLLKSLDGTWGEQLRPSIEQTSRGRGRFRFHRNSQGLVLDSRHSGCAPPELSNCREESVRRRAFALPPTGPVCVPHRGQLSCREYAAVPIRAQRAVPGVTRGERLCALAVERADPEHHRGRQAGIVAFGTSVAPSPGENPASRRSRPRAFRRSVRECLMASGVNHGAFDFHSIRFRA